MNPLLAMMGGGPLPIPRVPCALCLCERAPEPRQVATIVAGTATCEEHAGELLERMTPRRPA